MSQDPFSAFGAERTIIKPNLGKGKTGSPKGSTSPNSQNADPMSFEPNALIGAPSTEASNNTSLNELMNRLVSQPSVSNNAFIAQAYALIRLTLGMRLKPEMSHLGDLSLSLKKRLNQAESNLSQEGYSQEERLIFKYVMCTFIDEMAANTPWGASGAWAPNSLLLVNFNETWGGQKFFLLLDKMLKDPLAYRGLLELSELLLLLGFKGKFHLEENGASQLAWLKSELERCLRGDAESPQLQALWKSKAPPGQSRWTQLPIWLPFLIASLVCMSVFLPLYFYLNHQSDRLFIRLGETTFPALIMPKAVPAKVKPVTDAPTLEKLLSTQIDQGQVQVSEQGNRTMIRLKGDALFQSGQGDLDHSAEALIEQVGQAISQVPVLELEVTGYTDSVPIHSIRFPSNWALSSARADAVGKTLQSKLPGLKIISQGAGQTHPIASNATAQGRSLNRRVDIVVIHPGQ